MSGEIGCALGLVVGFAAAGAVAVNVTRGIVSALEDRIRYWRRQAFTARAELSAKSTRNHVYNDPADFWKTNEKKPMKRKLPGFIILILACVGVYTTITFCLTHAFPRHAESPAMGYIVTNNVVSSAPKTTVTLYHHDISWGQRTWITDGPVDHDPGAWRFTDTQTKRTVYVRGTLVQETK